jgi:LPS-assembly protein
MPALSLALALALGQIPPPQLAQPGSTATLTAKAAELEGGTHRVRAQGDVVVKSGDIAVRADAMEYDTEAREGTASGSVVLADGNLVLVGREASFSLLGEARLTVRWAELFQKLPGERPPVEKVSDLQSAHSFGHNAFVIRAEELELLGPGHARARSMRISSCDCGEAAPAWSIGAKAADLIMGERALLTWAAFYVKGIPVLPLPVVYMPLSERRTGFLLPRPAWANVDSSGFSIDEPFFLTLGRSWDVTLEAGYRFGAEETAEKAANNTRVGTKGVRLAAELRYAPSEATAGRFKVMAVDDRHHDIANGMYLGPRGWRGELSARHSTLFEDAAFARADVNLVSDKNLLLDEPFDAVVGLSQTWTRSLGLAEVKARGALLGAAATYYQDLAAALKSGWPSTRAIGQGAAVTLQRPGLAFLDAPLARRLGPVDVGLEASVARYQPFALFAGPAPSELVSRTRVQATPTIAWSPFADGPLRAEVYGWVRAEASAFEGKDASLVPSSELRARGAAGAYLGTELSRVCGGAWRHTVAPRLEVRALTRTIGGAPASVEQPTVCQSQATDAASTSVSVVPHDEYDLLPVQGCSIGGVARFQGVASIVSRLQQRGTGEVGRLEVGQDVDLRDGQAADLFGRVDLRIARLSLAAQGRYDWSLRRLAYVSAQASLADARGDAVSAGYDWVLGTLTDRLRGTVDDLFGPRAIPTTPMGSMNTMTVGATAVVFKWLSLSAFAALEPAPKKGGMVVTSASARAVLGRSCNECWRIEVGGAVSPQPYKPFNAASPRFLLELKNLGTFGN